MKDNYEMDDLWFGKLPSHWAVNKIGQLYRERKTKVSDYDYPALSVTMQGILPQLEHAAKTDAHDDRKLIRKGDFVINSRSDRRGSCGISDFDGSCSLINTVLAPKTEMNPQYYNWFFHTTRFAEEFYRWGHGIVDDLWTTRYEDMKRIMIPVPPLKEQERIASYLDKKCAAIDEAIARRQQMNEKLEEYRKAIIYRAVTKGLDSCAEMKDSEVSWIGRMPSSWDLKAAKHCVKIEHGSDPKTEGDVPVYGSGAISFKTCGEFKEGPTVLIGRKGATLHIPHYIEGRFWNVDTAFNVTAKEDYDLEFYYYVATVLDYKYYMTQTTLPSMTQFDYLNMKIPCPPKKEQIRIVCWLSDMCEKIDDVYARNVELIIRLEEYRKSIIYNAVTGKIDCREAV